MGLLDLKEGDEFDVERGLDGEQFDIQEAVSEEDPQMSARAWSRVMGEQIAIEDNLIGYATYMGPNAATSFDTYWGWAMTLCKFQSVPIYVQQDWEELASRSDIKLSEGPLNHIEYMRREELQDDELHELKAKARELNIIEEDEALSRSSLIDRIVEHEIQNEADLGTHGFDT